MKNVAVATIIVMAICTAALAHAGHDHVMGTVTKVAAGSIQVKTASGETKNVMIDDKTTYTKAGKKASLADVTDGARVVIDVHTMEGMLHAQSVKIGSATAQSKNVTTHKQADK
jgi:hypothetical protein